MTYELQNIIEPAAIVFSTGRAITNAKNGDKVVLTDEEATVLIRKGYVKKEEKQEKKEKKGAEV